MLGTPSILAGNQPTTLRWSNGLGWVFKMSNWQLKRWQLKRWQNIWMAEWLLDQMSGGKASGWTNCLGGQMSCWQNVWVVKCWINSCLIVAFVLCCENLNNIFLCTVAVGTIMHSVMLYRIIPRPGQITALALAS